MSTGLGIGNAGVVATLLLVLIKVLFVIFIIAIIGGIVVYIKNNIFTKEDIDTIKKTFSVKKAASEKGTCTVCGKTIETEWKLCPHCGKEKEI